MMAGKGLNVDGNVHELKLGKSFLPNSREGFHSVWFDFKPASLDDTQKGVVEIGEQVGSSNQVTITLPNQGHGKGSTTYKGKKVPAQRECVLVIDHDTGTFTLEKLTDTIRVKKTREPGRGPSGTAGNGASGNGASSNGGRSATPVEMLKGRNGMSPPAPKPKVEEKKSSVPPPAASFTTGAASPIGLISDSDELSDDMSDDEGAKNTPAKVGGGSAPATSFNILTSDLQLSEESSDSD